jgi:ABC-type transport system involved in multi-copper enzyme maturation permease subunit
VSVPTRKPPGLAYAALRVFDVSLAEMLWSRRTVFMALIVGLPVLLAVVIRGLVEIGAPMPRINRMEITGPVIFGLMIWAFFVRFSVPVLAVFYGTSLIADEVEDRTITYLFTRPIRREAVLLGKYLAYLVCTLSVMLPAVVLVWLFIVPIGGGLAESFVDLLTDLGLIALGLAVYGAVFALAGARLKRPLLVGLIFVFGWETLVLALPGTIRRLTVAHYLQGLVPHVMPGDSALSLLQSLFTETPTLAECLWGLALIEVVCLWLAARGVARREYVLEQ